MTITFALTTSAYDGAQAGVAANIPFPDITVTSDTFSIPSIMGTITSYVYNGYTYLQNSYQNWASFGATIAINGINTNKSLSYSKGYLYIGATKGWSSKSWTASSSLVSELYTQNYFNASNKTSRIVPITLVNAGWSLGNDWYNDYVHNSTASGSAVLILNVPPTFDNDYPTISKNTDNYYKNVTTITVNSDATAYYGGDISSTTLTIGNQTQTIPGNGSISIKLNTTGTFTPTLTVADSRGQTVTHTFDSITVIEGDDTTFESTQVNSNKDGFWTTYSKASVTISNIEVPYEGSATQTSFTIGSQTVTGTDEGILEITPNTAGTFAPIVSVTDSFGRVYSKNLNPITINSYQRPNITSIDVYRVEHNSDFGKMDDEGTWAVVQIPITYINQVSNLLQPIIKINGIDISTLGVSVKWYSSWNQISGLTNQISWTNYNPTSPTTVYALLRREFNFDTAYTISAIAKDEVGQQSDERTTTLTAAFFTVDFLAGGHGIAFGAPAKDEGFLSNMDTTFGKEIYVILDSDQAEGTDHDLIHGIIQLGWTDALR